MHCIMQYLLYLSFFLSVPPLIGLSNHGGHVPLVPLAPFLYSHSKVPTYLKYCTLKYCPR